ncbi:hypothetical protein trd_1410 [Thermomicrobium roseum DSM 5159]|uniref:Uncharacterized protein n=1 Tax=Thermomicrobium roseum (strain ATCC 27502 / DSM 5159 / P-2) TaxID=309801 RepID=B9L2K8_THERP|nr:hypothetical protein trd_1410 [Thermomicrobium roseum DSM 5159]
MSSRFLGTLEAPATRLRARARRLCRRRLAERVSAKHPAAPRAAPAQPARER